MQIFYGPISTTNVLHVPCCPWQLSAQEVRKYVLNRLRHCRYFWIFVYLHWYTLLPSRSTLGKRAAAHRIRSRQIGKYFIFTTLISTVSQHISFRLNTFIFPNASENTFIWFISLTISSWKADGLHLNMCTFLTQQSLIPHSSFQLTVICSSVIPLFFGA